MYLIIIGAGITGSYLIESATKDGHEVAVIEKDEEKAQFISKNTDCLVIHDNASNMEALKEAGAEKADALIATTSDDAVNLLVMMLGKELGIKHLVSSVQEDDHVKLFETLGIDIVASPYQLSGEFLYQEIKKPGVKDFMEFTSGAEIVLLTVHQESHVVNSTIQNLKRNGELPESVTLITIERDDQSIDADADTKISANDHVVLFSKEQLKEEHISIFLNSEKGK